MKSPPRPLALSPTRFIRRLRYWWQHVERARLLREEMEAHLEMKVHEFMEDGMNESDARAAARRQFGNPTRLAEESRETWIARWAGDLIRDAAFTVRTVARQPGFALVAVLSAALGIGACSLIFTLANFALFRPLPVAEPSRLVSISGRTLPKGKMGQSLTYPDFDDLRRAPSLASAAAYFGFVPATIPGAGEPRRYWGSIATANYFDVVRPVFALGHGFPGDVPSIVLSHRLWRTAFNGDPGIVGRTIEWNRRKLTVAGVTGPGFEGAEALFTSDFWVPFALSDSLAEIGMGGDRVHDRDAQWLYATARLAPGAGVETAAAELAVIGERLRKAYPGSNQHRGFYVERAGQVNPGMRKMLVALFLMLLVVAVLVLLAACANVANLLLARAAARRQEIATRLAIGAGRGRLVRQLLTESILLALAGGIGGYGLALAGAAALSRTRLPIALPVSFAIAPDHRVMLFCAALSMLTGVIFGLAPALRATRGALAYALKPARFGPRNLLVVGQVAVSMILLVSSGLFLRSFVGARRIDPGFSHRDVLMLSFDPALNRYSPEATARLLEGIVERTRAIPGVQSAALGSAMPLSLAGTHNAFSVEGVPDDPANRLGADIYSVSPGYFETLGIKLLAGTDFAPGLAAEDFAIANQALVDQAFPRQNPIGRRILYKGRKVRIAGVVATVKSRTIGEEPRPSLYLPIARDLRGNDSLTGITLALRTHGDAGPYAPLVRTAIRELDPALAIFDVRTMEVHLRQALFLPRAIAMLFGLAGLMGLLISTVGIYGVVSFAVARRTSEIGIRMALGATRGRVLAMILRQGFALVLAGVGIGLALALALSRVARSLLYGVSPTDPATFLAVPAFLLLVALAACLPPARRAAGLDPMRALRYD